MEEGRFNQSEHAGPSDAEGVDTASEQERLEEELLASPLTGVDAASEQERTEEELLASPLAGKAAAGELSDVGRRRRRCIGAALVVAVTGCLALAAQRLPLLSGEGNGLATRTGESKAGVDAAKTEEATKLWFGGTSKKTYEVWSLQTGCSNWQSIQITPVTLSSTIDKCGELCIDNPDCVMFNFQTKDGNGPGKNSCTLWNDKAECQMQTNSAQELYKITYTSSSAWGTALAGSTWFPQALNSGCSNWQQVQITSFVLATVDECGKRCTQTTDCKMFNFQVDPASECQGGGGPQGTCALLREGCKEEYNNCMDLYFTIDKLSVSYPQAVINSKALAQMNDGLEDAREDMNKQIPEQMQEQIKKQGYVMNEDGLSIPSMSGLESTQITMLEASSVEAQALAGKLSAHMVMVAKPLQPLVVPHAKATDGPIDIDFTMSVMGSWMEALFMKADVDAGPPLALTKMTVGQVYAGYDSMKGRCLGDMLGICSNMLQGQMDKSKGKIEAQLMNTFHDQMQSTFDENVPMYMDVQAGDGNCYIASKQCNSAVEWAHATGIHTSPQWYPGLTPASSMADFQNYLFEHDEDSSGCVPYCDPGNKTQVEAIADTKQFDRRLSKFDAKALSGVNQLVQKIMAKHRQAPQSVYI